MSAESDRMRMLELQIKIAEAEAAEDGDKSFVSGVADAGRSAMSAIVPFYDEITAAARATVDPSTYGDDRSWGERYDLAQEQEESAVRGFREDNPLSSIALETTSGFFSPTNKIGAVTQAAPGLYNAVKSLSKNVVRNATEAGIFGFGEGDENRVQSAVDSAQTAATFTGLLDAGGRTAAAGLDRIQLPKAVRPRRVVQDAPPSATTPAVERIEVIEEVPVHISNPDSKRAGFGRHGIGKTTGGNVEMKRQEAPFVLSKEERVKWEKENIARHKEGVTDDIDYQKSQADATAEGNAAGLEKAARQEQTQQNAAIDEVEGQKIAQANTDADVASSQLDSDRLELFNRQAVASLPVNASPELRAMAENVTDPKVFNDLLKKESLDSFGSVKNRSELFFDEKSLEELDALFAGDAALRNVSPEALKDVAGVRQRLDEIGIDPSDLDTPEKIIAAIMEPGRGVSGDDLLEIRNSFARGTTDKGGLSSAAGRQIARVLDNLIFRQLDEIDPALSAEYAADLAAYKVRSPLTTAITTASTNPNKRGYPTESDYIAAQGRNRGSANIPFRAEIEELQVASTNKPSPSTATAEAKVARGLEKAKADAKINSAKEQARLDKAAAAQTSQQQKKDSKRQQIGMEESMSEMNKELSDIKRHQVPSEGSAYMDMLLGGFLPFLGGKGNAASGVTRGSLLGDKLSTIGVQEFIAGQGKKTRALANALREGRTEYVTRALSREAAIRAAEQEEKESR